MFPIRRLPWIESPGSRRLVLGLLMVMAAISTGIGAVNAVHRSQDFQWSGARVLLTHTDAWAEYLQGDPHHNYLMSQVPNYTPILYVLIAPIGMMPLLPAKIVWMVCNVVFAVLSGILAARFYGMSRWAVTVVVCLLLLATPTRNSLGNGQQGLLVLVILCAALLAPRLTDGRAAGSGVSYFKFNFAPPIFLYLLLKGGVRAFLMSLVPSVIATVLVWFWITGGLDLREGFTLITEPLKVSQVGYSDDSGGANLMNALEPVLNNFGLPRGWIDLVTFSVAFLVCGVILYAAIKRHPWSSTQWQMALVATMSFCLFKHHNYDSSVLLLPLCYGLRLWRDGRAQAVLAIIVYLWYLQRVFDALNFSGRWTDLVPFTLLMVLIWLLFQLRSVEDLAEPAWQQVPVAV